MSATIYEDFISKFMPENTTEKTASNVLKLIVFLVGIVCTGLVYIVEHLGGILPLAIAFSAVCGGPLLGMFTLGILVPRCNSKVLFAVVAFSAAPSGFRGRSGARCSV